jgi:hypothetical protein
MVKPFNQPTNMDAKSGKTRIDATPSHNLLKFKGNGANELHS